MEFNCGKTYFVLTLLRYTPPERIQFRKNDFDICVDHRLSHWLARGHDLRTMGSVNIIELLSSCYGDASRGRHREQPWGGQKEIDGQFPIGSSADDFDLIGPC
jgi:hypothetical protein